MVSIFREKYAKGVTIGGEDSIAGHEAQQESGADFPAGLDVACSLDQSQDQSLLL
jgi:hypothetical protein